MVSSVRSTGYGAWPVLDERVDRLRQFREVRERVGLLQVELAHVGLVAPFRWPAKTNEPPSPSWIQPLGMTTNARSPSRYSTSNDARVLRLRGELADVALRVGGHELQRRFEQRLRPRVLVEGVPHRLAAVARHRLHAGLAALAALDHALQPFERVEAVALERP